MKILHLTNTQVTAENTPFIFSPSSLKASTPGHQLFLFSPGVVPPHKLALPLSSNILGRARGQQEAKNWWCLLTFLPFLLPSHLRLSSARCFTLEGCRNTNTVPARPDMHCSIGVPLDPFTHGRRSAILATAQKFPKPLSQGIASGFQHPQHCPKTKILFNLPEKPQSAKMRGAKIPPEVNSRHPNSLPCPNGHSFPSKVS